MFLPEDAAEAREMLQEIVARAKAGLTAQLEVLLSATTRSRRWRPTAWRLTTALPGELLRRYEMTSGRALNRTLELLLKLRLAGENSGFATAVAADLSAAIATAERNDNNPMLTSAVCNQMSSPRWRQTKPIGDRAIASGEANGECENAPNEANPAGPERDQEGGAEIEARNPTEERIEKPESRIDGRTTDREKSRGRASQSPVGVLGTHAARARVDDGSAKLMAAGGGCICRSVVSGCRHRGSGGAGIAPFIQAGRGRRIISAAMLWKSPALLYARAAGRGCPHWGRGEAANISNSANILSSASAKAYHLMNFFTNA